MIERPCLPLFGNVWIILLYDHGDHVPMFANVCLYENDDAHVPMFAMGLRPWRGKPGG